MSKPQLWKVTYEDKKGGLRLDCYADTIVFDPAGGKCPQLVAIRFGGEPEKVRGLADAIKNYVESITRASRYYGACDADRERFQCHNAVVAKIPPLNRLAVRYGLEPLFVPADEGQFERLLEKLNQGLPQGKTLASVLPPDLWKLREEIRIFAEVFYFEVVMNASDDQALNRLWNAKTMEYMRSLEA